MYSHSAAFEKLEHHGSSITRRPHPRESPFLETRGLSPGLLQGARQMDKKKGFKYNRDKEAPILAAKSAPEPPEGKSNSKPKERGSVGSQATFLFLVVVAIFAT